MYDISTKHGNEEYILKYATKMFITILLSGLSIPKKLLKNIAVINTANPKSFTIPVLYIYVYIFPLS